MHSWSRRTRRSNICSEYLPKCCGSLSLKRGQIVCFFCIVMLLLRTQPCSSSVDLTEGCQDMHLRCSKIKMKTFSLTINEVRRGQILCIHKPFSPLPRESLRLQRACVSSSQGAERLLFFQDTHGSSVSAFTSCVSSTGVSMGTAPWMAHWGQPQLRTSISKHMAILHYLCVKQPLMSQKVNEMSACQNSTLHSAISNECPLTSIIQYPKV